MESKILKVFYGEDNLPYKDKERQVHFPIVGSAFQGASNTTKIRFYIDRIGGLQPTWIAITKLPNGKVGVKQLDKSRDYTILENYVELPLSSFYTQAKGDIFITLNGYEGGVEITFNEDTGLFEIEGDPIIQATGSVKIAINYATKYPEGQELDEEITIQSILAELGNKLDKIDPNYIKVVDSLDLINTETYENYLLGTDVVFDKESKKYYAISGEYPNYQATEIHLGYDRELGCFKVYQSQDDYLNDFENIPVGQISGYFKTGELYIAHKYDENNWNDIYVNKAFQARYSDSGKDLDLDYVFASGDQVIHGNKYKELQDSGSLYATINDCEGAAAFAISEYETEHPIGQPNGIAKLDGNGKIPVSQLPSYVSDIIEYDTLSDFPAVGESGKIYIAKDTNLQYRWSGTQYVEISSSLALGETSDSAWYGNRGKASEDNINKINAIVDFDDFAIPTATNGTISESDLAILQANNHTLIHFNNQYYRLQDMNISEGFMTYNNNEYISGQNRSKTITITTSTRAWVLNDDGINWQDIEIEEE